MSKRELVLHVGHGKTGSTYLQALMTHNAARLAEVGVFYPTIQNPTGNSFVEGWQDRFASGNAQDVLSDVTTRIAPKECRQVVLSAESMCSLLVNGERHILETLQRFCAINEITHVRGLLFIRDAVELLMSAGAQELGEPSQVMPDLDRKNLRSIRVFGEVRKLLETKLDLPGYTLDVLNYSRHAHNLRGVFEGFLGITSDVLDEPDGFANNRTLCAPEYMFVRAAQEVSAVNARYLRDAFKMNVNAPKGVGRWILPLEMQQHFVKQVSQDIDAINALVPETERYQINYVDPANSTGPFEMDQSWFRQTGRAVGFMLNVTMIELKANQAQVELLTAQRSLSLGDVSDANAALKRADQHIQALSQISAPDDQRAIGMRETHRHLCAQGARKN